MIYYVLIQKIKKKIKNFKKKFINKDKNLQKIMMIKVKFFYYFENDE